MKVTFLYSNGKTFTLNNVVEESINIIRQKRKGLLDLVTVTYQVNRAITPDVIMQAVEELLSTQVAIDNGITSTFNSDELLYGVDVVQTVTIPATETGLIYIIVKEQENDIWSINQTVMDDCQSVIDTKSVMIIPVLERKIDPLILADCIHLTV